MIVTEDKKEQTPDSNAGIHAASSTPGSASPPVLAGSSSSPLGSTRFSPGNSTPETLSTAFNENPPDYTPAPITPFMTGQDPSAPNHGNHFIIKRELGNIKGQFSIDPTVVVPPALLPSLPSGKTQPSLAAETGIGAVEVDAHVISKANMNSKATIVASSQIGNVMVRLRESTTPISIFASAEIGAVRVFLPRNFRGTILLTTQLGKVSMSPAIRAVAASRSDIGGQRRIFVGDIQGPGWEDDGATWTGDEIFLQSQIGGVRVAYVDETEEPKSGWAQFTASLFGKYG